MASRRGPLALQGFYRWWKYEHVMKQIVPAAGLLLGASAGVMEYSNLYRPEVKVDSSRSSLSLDQRSWYHQAHWSAGYPPVFKPCNDDGGNHHWEPFLSRLGSLLVDGAHILLSESLPVELQDEFVSTGKNAFFTRHTVADAVAKAAPAVVNITVNIGGGIISFAQTAGSGFIIHPDGTILTNAHVVANDAVGPYKGKMVVTMQDGRTFPGEIVHYDLLADIAVVKVHSKKLLPTVKFGSSRKLRPGEWVIAVGSPLHLQNSVTVGIVSCVDRKSTEMGLQGIHADYIQTDAAINQGNSGGPLLNLDGEVIGINTIKALTADGVSFAIPMDSVLKIMQQLKKHGRVIRPWLGMKMLGLTEDIITQLKERDSSFPDVKTGVFVPQVIPGSPAARGGVRSGDVILEFDGLPISTPHQVVEALDDKVGVAFKLLIRRAKEHITLSVITEEASPSQ